MPNLTNSDILKLYGEASIFWHACGLGEKDPHLVEHFGMTTVEAMQNYCVPIVIDGGGQKEIVEHGVSGFSLHGQGSVILQAKWDALRGIPRMWRRRRNIQANRVASIGEIWKALDKRIF